MDKNSAIEQLKELLNYDTPVICLEEKENAVYVKREDCIPFSFGGNKVRIAASYFIDLINRGCDAVVTYGSSSSNLCRVIANMAYRYGIKCIIVSPEENYVDTPNSVFVKFLNAEIVKTKLDNVSRTIEEVMEKLRKTCNPYFIYGGGHGKLGTESYRVVLRQITQFENDNCFRFDRIFITLATGTSMSGLIIESSLEKEPHHIVGISVAREGNKANEIMKNAILEYKDILPQDRICSYEILDDYRCGGYGMFDSRIVATVQNQFAVNGMHLDTTYTGKGFCGMKGYLENRFISNERVLFIHTGGTPLFFRNNSNFLEEK